MTLPRTRLAKIMAVRYRLRFVKGQRDATLRDGKALGTVEWNRAGTPTISIDKDQPEDKVREAVWHEIIHALGGELGLNELLNTERITNPLARGIYCVVKDNPALARWLIGQD